MLGYMQAHTHANTAKQIDVRDRHADMRERRTGRQKEDGRRLETETGDGLWGPVWRFKRHLQCLAWDVSSLLNQFIAH